VDNYTQSNSVNVKTNRPLWEGATLDLSWVLRWSINKNYQISTDNVGRQTITSVTSTGQIERSYLAFPDFLFLSAFNTNIESVDARYQELKADATDTRTDSEKLSQAFEDGFEALPWLSEVLGSFMPRVNWGIRWDGIEKWTLLDGVADRISLEHRYTSTLSSSYRHSPDNGVRITESKRAQSGFNPLVGVNMGWNELWGGTMNVTARWNKTLSYNLVTASSNIQEQKTDEITVTANFRKQGFEMPFLGLTLQNDVEFSLTGSYNTDRQRTYEIDNLTGGGQPREGTIRYTIEPRVRYSISSRVNASIFYRYQRTKPNSEGGSSIPGTTIHEAGLELKITIAG
jgi:cell surface protein SprA